MRARVRNNLFYGWVVLGALFVIGTTIWGTRFTFGVFFKSLESEFALSRTATSAVFSAYTLLCSGVAILGGLVADKYGPRRVVLFMGLATGVSLLLTSLTSAAWQLFITYSLLLSIGTGAMYVVVMSTTSRWFDKRRGLALGIAGSGSGLGMAIAPPLVTYLISDFGWRNAYLIMAIVICLVVLPLSRVVKRDPGEIGMVPDGARSTTGSTPAGPTDGSGSSWLAGLGVLEAFRTRSFWFFSGNDLLLSSAQFFLLTHLVPHVTDLGFLPQEAALVLGVLGGIGVLSRVMVGAVADRMGRKATAVASTFVMAGILAWLIWAQELWMFYLFALVYGFAFGGRAAAMAALIGDTFGLRNIGAILGILEIGWAIGAALGPALGGLIFDMTDSYLMAFVAAAVATLAATLLIIPIRRETDRPRLLSAR